MLETLTDKEINVHTLMQDSGKMDMFVYNTLKKTTMVIKIPLFM